jgi:glucose-1-phosphate thymidylyltransferase
MRPHTWSKPKPLISVAGKTSLEHIMDMFASLPDPANVEYVFIIGPYLAEQQLPPFIETHYPDITAHFVVQREMRGQSHALWLAREHMRGPMIMCFSDSLLETDFGFLAGEQADGVAWVMPVPDPRRFGVAELDAEGWVTRFIEKPKTLENNLAVAGCYYFKSARQLFAAIEEQMQRGVTLHSEYFLTDAVTLMLGTGAKVRTERVISWLDTGTVEATLDTNRVLLEKLAHGIEEREGVTVFGPVYIHPSAEISDSVIGPFVSIGPRCKISGSRIEDSILEEGVQVKDAALIRSIIGKEASVTGKAGNNPLSLNIGDNSSVVY